MVLKTIMENGARMKSCSRRNKNERARRRPSLVFIRLELLSVCRYLLYALFWMLCAYLFSPSVLSICQRITSWRCGQEPFVVEIEVFLGALFFAVYVAFFVAACVLLACEVRTFWIAKASMRTRVADIGVLDLIECTLSEKSLGKGLPWLVLWNSLRSDRSICDLLEVAEKQKMRSQCAKSCVASVVLGGLSKTRILERFEEDDCRRASAHREISSFSQAALTGNLRYAVTKGLVLECVVYPKEGYRNIGDVDVLVHPEDAVKAHEILLAMGYRQALSPTSASSWEQGRKMAALALADDRQFPDKIEIENGPVRRHQYGDQFAPYRKEGSVTIELHDSLRGLAPSSLSVVLADYVVERDGCKVADPVVTSVLLIASAYQNSESFCSVLFDQAANLRDYYELKLMFGAPRFKSFWLEARSLISSFGIERQWSVVRYNYEMLYGEAAIPGPLRDVAPRASRWGVDIISRLEAFEAGRKAALSVFRSYLREDSGNITVSGAGEQIRFVPVYGVADTMFGVRATGDGTWMVWRVPQEMYLDESVVFECACYPLNEDEKMTSVKICVVCRSGKTYALMRKSDRFNEGLFLRKSGQPCEVESESRDGFAFLSIRIDCANASLADLLLDGSAVLHPGQFQHVGGNVYWRMGSRAVHDECRLFGAYVVKAR